MGHRRIGIIEGGSRLGNPEKREGYLQALREAGLAFEPGFVAEPRGHAVAGGYGAMERLMTASDRVTAVFAANDSLAIGALRWTQMHGLAVPRDVAIIGFDNIEFAEHAATPLSSVNYAVEMVTELAVERLIELISGGDTLPEARVTLIDPDLIIRDSTKGARSRSA
jgi:LacI family transcriptional regulator